MANLFSDLFFGKSQPGQFAPTKEIELPKNLQAIVDRARQLQFGALGEELDAADKISPDQLARAQISGQKFGIGRDALAQRSGLLGLQSGILGGVEDQRRNVREAVLRQGLGDSSMGLAQEAAVGRSETERLGQITQGLKDLTQQKELAIQQAESGRFGLEELARRQQLQGMLGIAGGALGMPGASPEVAIGTPGGREGGLLSTLSGAGAFFGGMYGGPQGAKAGARIGAQDERTIRAWS